MNIEVTVINDSHLVGYLASMVREGEIYMKDVPTMVNNVLSALRGPSRTCSAASAQYAHQLSRLNILDHGNPSGIQIGADWVDATTLPRFAPTLSRLAGHFSPIGFVHPQHCQVGQNQTLMAGLAKTIGVPVYAGTGSQNPIYRINFGDYVRADPKGNYAKAGRP